MAVDIITPEIYETSGFPRRGLPPAARRESRCTGTRTPPDGVPGFWAVTRYDDVVHVSRHPELFSSHVRTSMFEELTDDDVAAVRHDDAVHGPAAAHAAAQARSTGASRPA